MDKEDRLYIFKMALGLVEFDEAVNEAVSKLSTTRRLQLEQYKKITHRLPNEIKPLLLESMKMALDVVESRLAKGDKINEDELQQCFMKFVMGELRAPESKITPLQLMKRISDN
jgi:hypothetical protein